MNEFEYNRLEPDLYLNVSFSVPKEHMFKNTSKLNIFNDGDLLQSALQMVYNFTPGLFPCNPIPITKYIMV